MRFFVTLAFAVFGLIDSALASPFTTAVPGTSLVLPSAYPEAGGVAIVMVGANGNVYYQFSNPSGAFVGYNNSGTPAAFMGNPFTINSAISLNCGYSSCATYFGGSIAQVYIRFTANDGDTSVGNFDYNDITLRINGYDVGNWSAVTTQSTNLAGTVVYSTHLGFSDGSYDTGWFSSTNSALLANILSTGKTLAQVYDRDPNDNYWDFSSGTNLSNTALATVAPGYSLTKTSSTPTFTAVGQQITYTYVVTNIGSVTINNLSVSDNKIASISCNKTSIIAVASGQTPDKATCTGVYTVTQADFDAEKVTNIAQANGVPAYGSLGALTATATVTGPTISPAISLSKTSSLSTFGAVGSTVPYTLTATNGGNATLTNVVITDPKLPSLSCSVASLAPAATKVCTANYTVTQADVDAFANGTQLSNTASVTSRDPKNVARTATATLALNGPAAVVTMTVAKTTSATTYATVGQSLAYQIAVKNTGTITWPAAPTVTDSKTTVSCPAGAVAPNATVTCTATYTVTQADIDANTLVNTASATVTVSGKTAAGTSSVTLTPTRTTSFSLDKRLAAASPTSFANTAVALTYQYVLVNTGTATLNTVAVGDNKVAVTCPSTTIAPGATLTCTSAAYSTTQADLNAGSVVNTATATAVAAGTAAVVTSNTDTQSVPAVQTPAISLTKSAPVLTAPQFISGATVTYSYTVTNSGNIDLAALPAISVTDDKIGTFPCGSGALARGASRTCTADYVLTDDDITAGIVVNKATASNGALTSGQVSATISPSLSPSLSLVKTASPTSVSSTATTVTYSFLVTNTGTNQIVRNTQRVTINDPMLGTFNCGALQPFYFNAGSSFTCTKTYKLTQAQMDAGQAVNTATASYPFTSGGVVSTITAPASTATVTAVQSPSLALTKTGPASFTAVGQVLSYSFAVKNTGNVTLTTTTVTDPKIPALGCTLTTIAPNATKTCTGSYTVTQADMDAGSIVNTASAQGATAAGGSASGTDTSTANVAGTVVLKRATLTKTASPTSFSAVGQSITYTMAVANTGAQTLTGITVTDVLNPSYSCAIATLAPAATNSSCTYTHVVTQADLDAAKIDNTASAASADFTTLTASKTVTGPARVANFTLTKAKSSDYTAAGQVVNFTFTVKNTGNVTLTNVNVTDAFFTPAYSCTVASLAPGASDSSCTKAYTVTQTNVDNGSFTNTANATATPPAGVTSAGTKSASVVVNGPASAPAVTIVKTPSATSFGGVGSSISYGFVVTNSGNVTLSNLTVSDTALGFSCAVANLAPGASASTCSNATALTASRTMTQADVDLGSYSNTAKVTGQSLVGATAVTDTDVVTVKGPAQTPTISLTKTSSLVGGFDHVGQSVPYTYTIANTGNITLTGTFTVADNKIPSVSCAATPAAGLAPLATLACTGSYLVTQADLDAGQVANHAVASTNQPVVPVNPSDPSIVQVSAAADKTVSAVQLPALSLDKHVKASSTASYAHVGDQVTFEYVVKNTGNVTTTAPITLVDNKITGTLTCSAATVAPQASVTCEQVWTATQADLDAGSVTNTATASTVYKAATVNSNTDQATITAVQNPSLSVVKTFTGTSAPGLYNVDDTLSYSFVVTNNGTVTINGPITLTDNLTSPVCDALPGNKLAPNATLSCTATHVVSANEFDLGATMNVVTAAGSFNGQAVVSPADDAIYPVDADPALTLTKTALSGAIPFSAVGQTITYRYTLDNTGNVSLVEPLYITDDKLGGGARLCHPASVFKTDDAPISCDFTYTVTQADVDRGFVTNNATASTVYAPGGPATSVVSANASVTVNATETPALTVTKAVISGANPAVAGSVLTYRITTLNSGNQTISGVAVTDAKVGALTCTQNGAAAPANVVLLPSKSLICTANYTVTQADIDAQILSNTATARGSDPHGVTVTDSDTITHPLVVAAPSVEVTKAVTPAPGPDAAFSAVGQPVKFVVTVRNTGNVTLNSTVVTDDLASGSCTVGALAPNAVDTSCSFTVPATQAFIDAVYGPAGATYGGFTNTVTATSQPANPAALSVTDTGTAFAKGPSTNPSITLAKNVLTAGFSAAGDSVSYQFVVANTGNVTLTAPAMIDDPLLGAAFACGAWPVGGLAPLDNVICTKTYTVSQADVDAGVINNTAKVSSAQVPYPTGSTAADLATKAHMTASASLAGTRTPAVTIAKVASITSNAKLGDVISYSYTVKNTGNVTLTALTPTDQHSSAAGTVALTLAGDALKTDAGILVNSTDAAENGIWDSLAPQDEASFTASYTVTQADIDKGAAISNTVTLATTSPSGTTAPTASATVNVPVIASAPVLDVQKRVDATGLSSPVKAGDVLAYTVTVENKGNTTLNTVALVDTLRDASGAEILPKPVLAYVSGDNGDAKLQVGEVWSYAKTITLTQAMIDAGGVSNSATATAKDPFGTAVSDISDNDGTGASDPTATVLARTPAMTIAKTASITSGAKLGDVIGYTYTVKNTGNVTLTAVTPDDQHSSAAGTVALTIAGDALKTDAAVTGNSTDAAADGAWDTLGPSDEVTFTASYTVTQADIDKGADIANTVTLAADGPTGTSVPDATATLSIPVVASAPVLDVQKRVDATGLSSPVKAGDVLAYTVTVENKGNTTLNTVALVDTLRDASGAEILPKPVLAYVSGDNGDTKLQVGEVWSYAKTITLTQAMIDAGGVSNSATATAKDPFGTAVSDISDNDGTGASDPTATVLAPSGGLEVVKTAAPSLTAPPKPLDVIDYTITVRNTGNVTLKTISLTDSPANGTTTGLTLTSGPTYDSGNTGDAATLAPNEVWTYLARYTLTQADIDSGVISNAATASAKTPAGASVSDLSDDTGAGSDPTLTTLTRSPSLTATKSKTLNLGADGVATVGDTIDYSYTVKNTGNTSLLDIGVTETIFTGSGTAPVPSYASGGSTLGGAAGIKDLGVGQSLVFKAQYTLTQTDIDAGFVDNQASASATAPDGSTVSDLTGATASDDLVTKTLLPSAAAINAVKTADISALSSPAQAGDVVSFTITLTNAGNVTLNTVSLAEDFKRRDGTALALTPSLISGDAAPLGKLNVGEVWTYTASYSLTQDDIDAGGVTNSVTASAKTPAGASLSDVSDNGNDSDGNTTNDATKVLIQATPKLSVDKAIAASTVLPFDHLGQVISYEFTVTNLGNVTLTAPVLISDALIEDAGGLVSCPVGAIAPAGTKLCTGSYAITQADLDRGSVDNIATASVNQPVVPLNAGDPTKVLASDDSATVTALGSQLPKLALAKAIQAGSKTSFSAIGDQVSFEYTLTNSGNVTLAGPLTVTDDKIAGTLSCGLGPLAPAAIVTCSQVWTATQDDLDVPSGEIINTAIGHAKFGAAAVNSAADTATITATQTATLAMTKTLRSAVPDLFSVNTLLTYDFLVTNTGNVTVDGPISISDSLTTATCDPQGAGLAPNATLACSATYSLRSGDIQLGSTVNVAHATGSFAGVAVTSASDSAIYPAGAKPALSIAKDTLPAGVTFSDLDQVLTYRFTVTNSGKADLSEDIIVNDARLSGPLTCHSGSIFSVGAVATCDGTYTVTQADLDRGFILNEAVATTTFAPGTSNEIAVVSPPSSKTTQADEMPELTVAKTITSTAVAAKVGDTVDYQIIATNSGNQTLRAVGISDPLLDSLTCTPSAASVTLLPGADLTCTGSYVVTQADIDAQSLQNTATASGNDPHGDAVTGSDSVTQPLDPAASSLTVVKSLLPDPGTGTAFATAGKELAFAVTLTNSGNITLNNLSVGDDLAPNQSCTLASLAPGASNSSCRFTYTTTQADVDALFKSAARGGFVNTATAKATPANPGAAQTTVVDTLDVLGPQHAPAFALQKSADVTEAHKFGDVIGYSYLVTNSGNITLYALPQIADDKIDSVTCPALPVAGLPPMATVTCTASYSVTQADVDAGFVTNKASVTSAEVTKPATDSVTVPIPRAPALSIVKSASVTTGVKVGDVIDYTYTVENTGNTMLTDVSLNDQHSSASGTESLPIAGDALMTDAAEAGNSTDAAANAIWDSLGPQDVVTFTASYTVTQADIDAVAPISNTVTATATSPLGPLPTPPTDTVSVTPAAPAPQLTVLKTVDLAALSVPPVAGEVLPYTITVQNTGNQTLHRVTLSDTPRRADGTALTLTSGPTYLSGDTAALGDMEVGETRIYTASYKLTQADIDAGGMSNQALASALTPSNVLISDLSDPSSPAGNAPTRLTIAPAPSILGTKTMTAAPTTVGATVEYLITVENTGNVTLKTVSVASDTLTRADGTVLALTSGPSFAGATKGSGAGILLPGEVASYSASYTLTQDDLDAGGIANKAVVSGKPPLGPNVTDATDNGNDTDGNTTDDVTRLSIDAAPSIALVKRLATGSGPTYSVAGQSLSFDFIVTNTGNVTLTDALSITDAMITDAGGSIACPAGALAPLASVTCTGSYSVTQADVDAGSLTNRATANSGATSSPEAVKTVRAIQTPSLSVVKTAQAITATEFTVGKVVSYNYVVTNSGNISVTAPISIHDNRIAANAISCPALPAGGLAPAQSLTCTAEYTVTSDDVDLGSVTNLATGTDGVTTSPISSETIPEAGVPALSIVKTATSGANFTAVGDVIDYSYSVTNTGTRAFVQPVKVIDDKLGEITCFTPSAADPDFTAGESVTCTAQAVVTQPDLDLGRVVNQAYASTTYGASGAEVTSDPATVTVTPTLTPELTLTKTATPSSVVAVGDVISYHLSAVNTGNQTLTDVEVLDPMLAGFACSTGVLLPTQSLQCDQDYTVTQADIDRGTLVNAATAYATTPQGAATGDAASHSAFMPAEAPALTLIKSAVPTPFGAAGSVLTYRFTLINAGNVTLTDLSVTDAMDPSFACTVAKLAPQAQNTSCTMAVTVTQAQVDAGSIDNSADASSKSPSGAVVAASASLTTAGPISAPALKVVKVVTSSGAVAGAQVQYQLIVRNTGNQTLIPEAPVDTMTRADGTPTALEQPFALVSGDSNTDGRLDLAEVWIYRASHILTQTDIDAGGLSNSASLAAATLHGAVVSDVSDNGNDSDGNTTDDATVLTITPGPALDVTKTVSSQGDTVTGSHVVFTITAVNTGTVTLTDIAIADSMARSDGTAIPDQLPTGGATSLAPNEAATWTLDYILTQPDIDAGGLQNSALVTAKSPDGAPVADLSDNGNDSDGNTSDDATVLPLIVGPDLTVIKTITQTGAVAGDTVIFTVVAQNTGGVTLHDIAPTDTMTRADGVAILNQTLVGPTRPSLAPTQTATWTLAYVLTQDDVDAGGLSNSAAATATAPNGQQITDVSDNGAGAGSDPTQLVLHNAPALKVTKVISSLEGVKLGNRVRFLITAKNIGNVTLTDLAVTDTMTRANGVDIAGQVPTGGTASLAPEAEATWTLDYLVTQDDIDEGGFSNSATVSAFAPNGLLASDVSDNGDDTDGNRSNDATRLVIVPPTQGLATASKSADRSSAVFGETITYTLTFENGTERNFIAASVIDQLPAGLAYTPATARLNGVALEPSVAGNTLTFTPVNILPGATAVLTLAARVVKTDGAGSLTNTTWLLDRSGAIASNKASATVKITPEAVFDCTDIIGKVFDDVNRDGYPDAKGRTAALTDDDVYRGDKFGKSPLASNEVAAEKGIAGVRLVTVNGLLITTDDFGRFHVPCAALPRDAGSNFTLKLDTRTLPQGYKLTTENPRSLRVTPGKVAKMNFGAAMANVINIDLTKTAFDQNGQPKTGLIKAIKTLVAKIKTNPTALALQYQQAKGESTEAALARLKVVEALIRREWRGQGHYQLEIDRSVSKVK